MVNKHKYSSVYFPESNSTVERFHGTLKSRLDKLLFEGVDFHTDLCQVMYDIRSLPNKSNGVSPFEKFFNRAMPTIWQDFKKDGFTGTRIKLSDAYKMRNKHSKYQVKRFHEGQRVILRRGKGSKFDIPAKIVRSQGHGAWLVVVRCQIYNQKFIKPYPHSDLELLSKTKSCYDMLQAWEDVNESSVCDSGDVATGTHRYFLRPNRKRNYRF